jgi:hypothetical protein
MSAELLVDLAEVLAITTTGQLSPREWSRSTAI